MNTTTPNRRKDKRFLSKKDVTVDFQYPVESQADVITTGDAHSGNRLRKYHGTVVNVSAAGLCFHCEHKLKINELLNLELHVSGRDKPLCMQGQVRWSKLSWTKGKNEFDTGIQLTSIEGRPIKSTVYYDDKHHLYWSETLEMITEAYKADSLKNTKN